MSCTGDWHIKVISSKRRVKT